jgi:hypothetical protein
MERHVAVVLRAEEAGLPEPALFISLTATDLFFLWRRNQRSAGIMLQQAAQESANRPRQVVL